MSYHPERGGTPASRSNHPARGNAAGGVVACALRAAVTRAAAAFEASDGSPRSDLEALLGTVVDQLLGKGGARHARSMHLPYGLTTSHVDALRSVFVSALRDTEPGPAAADPVLLVDVLVALDDLQARVETGATNQFVEKLSAPAALEAVIEMAHDMRAPLGSILFLVDAIRRGRSGTVTPVQERQLGLIYGAALGLSNVASDVVDAVRGNRLIDGNPRPFSLTETLQGVAAIVRPIGEEKGLPVGLVLPKVDGRMGYPAALHRALLNLLSNALRYTETGSVTMGCDEPSPTRVCFWVKDTGTGIPPHVMAMLYDGFRPGVVGLRFSNAGLGLAICRSLLNAMGSTLTVDTSTTGTRFSFEVELPPVQ